MPRHSPFTLFSLIFFVSILKVLVLKLFTLEFFRIRQKKPFSFTSLYPFAYSIFKVLSNLSISGGLKWTRTTDLTLIRRAL